MAGRDVDWDPEKDGERRDRHRPLRTLEPGRTQRMERTFGRDFSAVTVDESAGARSLLGAMAAPAAARGNTIYLDRREVDSMDAYEQEALWAHELAHVSQQTAAAQRQRGGPPTLDTTSRAGGNSRTGSSNEESADATAVAAASRLGGGTARIPRLSPTGLQLSGCSNPVQESLDGTRAFTPDLARQVLDRYRGMGDADRNRAVQRYYPTGAYHRLLRALPAADASGPYADVTQDMLQRIQRLVAVTHAAGLGLGSRAAMAQAQATRMDQQNQAAAQAAHGPSPTTAQVAQEQASQVAQTSIAPSASGLSPAQIASWTTRANNAVTAIVNHAKGRHPELHLKAADFHVDVVGIEARGARVVAYGTTISGRNVCVVGRPFVELVDRDPAYAMSVVVHELHGHPDYGPYGQPGTELGLELYDQAAARMPGYTQPTGQARTAELDAYGYQETEIYSLLRSLPYHTRPTAAHGAVNQYSIDPATTVAYRVALIKQQWEARVAQSLLRGLYQRLRHDPRITALALTTFEQAVRTAYAGPDAAVATAILQP